MIGSKHWWTSPSFGMVKKSVTDDSVMSPDILYYIPFQPIKRQAELISEPYSGLTLHVVSQAQHPSNCVQTVDPFAMNKYE